MIFNAVSQSRTSAAVIDQLERLILEGVLRAGEKLPPERELAVQLDVSRPVLRTALKDLEGRQLVTCKQGGGSYVADIVGTLFTEEMYELIQRHPKAQNDYFEFRRDMEGMITERAAVRATDADKLILSRILQTMRALAAKDDFRKESETDVEFHQAIVEASHNLMMLHTMRSCFQLLSEGLLFSRIKLFEWPELQAELLEQHQTIFDAIVARRPTEARLAAETHIDFVQQSIERTQQAGNWEEVSRMRLSKRAEQVEFPSEMTSSTHVDASGQGHNNKGAPKGRHS